jgi:hypothetical protein
MMEQQGITCMGERKISIKLQSRDLKGKTQFGRPKNRWEDNV